MPGSRGRGAVVVVAAALVVAALILLALWAMSGDAPHAPPPVLTPTPQEPARPAKRPVARPRSDAAPNVRSEPAPDVRRPSASSGGAATRLDRSIALRVRVVTSSGAPAAAADVLALDPLGPALTPPAAFVRARGVTDASGESTIRIDGGSTVLRVLASLGDEAGVAGVEGDGADRSVTIHLGAALRPVCRTVGAEDEPVAGAKVTLAALSDGWPVQLEATSQADGSALFPAIPADGIRWIEWSAEAAGRAPAVASGQVRHMLDVTLRLEPATTVRGRVVDESGAPVAGATVMVAGAAFATTGADGTFAVTGLPPAGGDVVVTADGYAPAARRGLAGDAGEVVLGDVVLTVGGRVAGIVVDDAARPSVGAKVVVSVRDTALRWETVTDAEGRFAFDHMGTDEMDVEAEAPPESGSWASRRRARIAGVRAGQQDLRLALDGHATVVLRFLAEADRSPVRVASVKLTATSVGETPAQNAWAWSARDIDSVRFEPESSGTFDLTIEVPGWNVGVARGVEVIPDRELTIDVLFRRGQ